MCELAYLTACYILGSRYHSGQWSRGYRALCLAQKRALVENSGLDIGRVAEHLDAHTLYRSGSEFRNAVAAALRRMRHSRHSL